MKIAVIGTGYVGLVSGTCFAEMGNDVFCVDIEEEKIDKLKKGIVPIYEPGLEDMVLNNIKSNRLKFTINIEKAICQSNICFIAVGTPMGEDGSADIQHVLKAAKQIGQYMKHHMYVINKSTVPVGTAKEIKECIKKELDRRGSELTFDIISNPEFLKEGAAISDCMKPDRIVVGVENERAYELMQELYTPFIRNTENFIVMDIKSAEMTKYAANAMLATKISFMNQIASICEKVGADINKVRKGIGSDNRIGFSFIYPGCGYGGSCFPKDIKALIQIAKEHNCNPDLLEAVQSVNKRQKQHIVKKVVERFGEDLSGLVFAVWGLAFKPETDDMRESSAIDIIENLTKKGAKVKAYDPKAINQAREYYLKDNKKVEYVDSKYTALNEAQAMILITEWKEFRSPDFEEIGKRLQSKIIFDGRNQYNKNRLKQMGFEYYQIGVS